MKRLILPVLVLAATSAWAQTPAARVSISETAYHEALEVAEAKAGTSGQRLTVVWHYFSNNLPTKTVTHVSESLPGRRYRSRTVTEVNGSVTEREEHVRVGDREYHRINNGKWKVPPIPMISLMEMPPGYKPPVVVTRNEYFRIRAAAPGEPDIYIWEQTTTTDGIPEVYTLKHSILNGLIVAADAVKWEKTPANITKTEVRTYEHNVQGLKVELPVFTRRSRLRIVSRHEARALLRPTQIQRTRYAEG